MNKVIIWIFLFITLVSAVFAEEIQINTTIDLDFVGSDVFWIRTEGGDHQFTCASQNDSEFNMSFTKEVDLQIVNMSMETKVLLDAFKNVTEEVATLHTNTSNELGDVVRAHERVVIYYDDCKVERKYFEDKYNNETKLKEIAQALTLTNTNTINRLRQTNANCTITLDAKEEVVKNRFWLGFFVAAGIAGAGYWFMEDQKKGKVPQTMKDSGHPGLTRTTRK